MKTKSQIEFRHLIMAYLFGMAAGLAVGMNFHF